jgi:large subunit ribosomal protein L6
MSRVGKKIIPLPKGVELKMNGRTVTAKGPKGQLSCDVVAGIELEVGADSAEVRQTSTEKTAGALHGLSRALINNLVEGVSVGFSKSLEIHGTGYRAQVQDTKLVLSLGFSQPIEYSLPQGITAVVEGNKITVSGIEKAVVGQTAAEIRRFRPPEPYKGKGVRYEGEHVRRKAGKSAGA